MKFETYRVFSLDISSYSTGWCCMVDGVLVKYGTIKLKTDLDKSRRLLIFREELKIVLEEFKPNFIVIENGFYSKNVKTLKTLSNFSGVAMECCLSITEVVPYIMNNTTSKAYFKVKTKKDLFNKVVKTYNLTDFKFEDHNDITDSIAQAQCYYEQFLKGTWG